MTIQEQAQKGSNWEYLCSLLRSLLAVPYDNLVGRTMWRQIVNTTNRVVAMNMKETEDFLTNQDVLDLIEKKQLLNERYDAIREEDMSNDSLRKRIHELEDEIEEMKRKTKFGSFSGSDYSNRFISDMMSQLTDVMNVKYMREDPVYSKYFALLESGAKIDDVVELCKKEGNDEKVVRGPAVILTVKDSYVKRVQDDAAKTAPAEPSKSTVSAMPAAPADDPNDPRKKPEYQKWFRLLKMNIPKEHLIPKMIAEGVDPSILDYQPPQTETTQAPADDPNDPRKKPEFQKWFRLLKMNIPKEHLIPKMIAEGVDPSILDYGSNGPNGPNSSNGPNPQPAQSEEEWRPAKKEEKKPEEKKPKSTRRKAKQEPEQKMKNIHWDPVDDDKIDASAWRQMKDSVAGLDYSKLTSMFKAKENTFLMNSEANVDLSVKKQEEMVQLVTDAKRLRNVGMAIARLKCSYQALKVDILRVDDTVLNDDMVRILRENAPTEEEIELVKGYDGSVELLNDVDRFFKVLSTIPNLQTRLKCIFIRKTLPNDLRDAGADFRAFGDAMELCVESEKFCRLLELILAIGNYMNGVWCVCDVTVRQWIQGRLLRLPARVLAQTARHQVGGQQADAAGVRMRREFHS